MDAVFVRAFGQSPQAVQRTVNALVAQAVNDPWRAKRIYKQTTRTVEFSFAN
jgi:hypothetical protein